MVWRIGVDIGGTFTDVALSKRPADVSVWRKCRPHPVTSPKACCARLNWP